METRHALNGVRWPSINPKVLVVEFSTEATLQKAIEATTGGKAIDMGGGSARDRAMGDRSAADERRVSRRGRL